MDKQTKFFKKGVVTTSIVIAIVIAIGAGTVFAINSKTKNINIDEAKSIALEDAGVGSDSVTFTKHKLEYDDGVKVYDIDFYTQKAKYEYEINATTGAIIDRDYEAIKEAPSKDNVIGVDKAKSIALNHAGVSADKFKKAKLERDDGVTVYEIEFIANGIEYEYVIDAKSGNIIEYDVEHDD